MKAVTFEIATTLVRLASPSSRLFSSPLRDALKHYNLPCPTEPEMKAAFRRANSRVAGELRNYGAEIGLNEREWWQNLVHNTLEEAGCGSVTQSAAFDLVFQRAYSSFGASGSWEAAPSAEHAMRHAKRRGLIVGGVDNLYSRYVDNNLPAVGLHEHLDFAVLSHELDVAKPDAGIFEAAAHRAAHASRLLLGAHDAPLEPTTSLHGAWDAARLERDEGLAACWCGRDGVAPLAPAQMLHVGSSLEDDYLAAKRCGMHALLLDPKRRHAHAELQGGDVLGSLAELPERIDALLGTS